MAKKKVEVEPVVLIDREPFEWGYARVSTHHQDLDIQLKALEAEGIPEERIFTDKLSGKRKVVREGLDELLTKVQPGDTIVAYKLDRLGRSTAQVTSLFNDLEDKGIFIRILSGPMKIDTSNGKSIETTMIITMMSLFAEMERHFILERTNAGLEMARQSGKKFGPKYKHQQAYESAIKDFLDGKGTILELLEKYRPDGGKLSEQTFYRKKREYIARMEFEEGPDSISIPIEYDNLSQEEYDALVDAGEVKE